MVERNCNDMVMDTTDDEAERSPCADLRLDCAVVVASEGPAVLLTPRIVDGAPSAEVDLEELGAVKELEGRTLGDVLDRLGEDRLSVFENTHGIEEFDAFDGADFSIVQVLAREMSLFTESGWVYDLLRALHPEPQLALLEVVLINVT